LAVGHSQFRLDRIVEAERVFRRAADSLERLANAQPLNARHKHEYGRSSGMLGELLLLTQRREEARASLILATSIAEELVAADGENPELRHELGLAHYRNGCWHLRYDPDGAREAFEKCNAVREALAKADPANERLQVDWMLVQAHLGNLERVLSMSERLLSSEKIDIEIAIECARAHALGVLTAVSDESRLRHQNLSIHLLARVRKRGPFPQYLQLEPDFDPIRSLPEFQALVENR
jgi:hypothetical protein